MSQRLNYPAPSDRPLDLDGIVTLAEFENLAQARLHPAAYAYYARGAWDEVTLRDNLAAWGRYQLLPRVLRDADPIDLSTTLLGQAFDLPFGIAPSALHGMAHSDGEMAMARGAASAGALMVAATPSSKTLEEIASATAEQHGWFQLYPQADPAITRSLVERAASAGYRAIVLTVDLPVLGYRDEVLRSAFDPGADAYGNLPLRGGSDLDAVVDQRGAHLTWDSLDEIRGWSALPLVIKGILSAHDAALALEHGADAIWVSNHGGRQLDRVPAAIDMLAEISAAVGGRAEIYVDGGVRRGTDVATALALGARAVFLARPFIYALAVAGQAGVEHALSILREETTRAFVLLGVRSASELGADYVRRR